MHCYMQANRYKDNVFWCISFRYTCIIEKKRRTLCPVRVWKTDN